MGVIATLCQVSDNLLRMCKDRPQYEVTLKLQGKRLSGHPMVFKQ